jgi:hypothetical protein
LENLKGTDHSGDPGVDIIIIITTTTTTSTTTTTTTTKFVLM